MDDRLKLTLCMCYEFLGLQHPLIYAREAKARNLPQLRKFHPKSQWWRLEERATGRTTFLCIWYNLWAWYNSLSLIVDDLRPGHRDYMDRTLCIWAERLKPLFFIFEHQERQVIPMRRQLRPDGWMAVDHDDESITDLVSNMPDLLASGLYEWEHNLKKQRRSLLATLMAITHARDHTITKWAVEVEDGLF